MYGGDGEASEGGPHITYGILQITMPYVPIFLQPLSLSVGPSNVISPLNLKNIHLLIYKIYGHDVPWLNTYDVTAVTPGQVKRDRPGGGGWSLGGEGGKGVLESPWGLDGGCPMSHVDFKKW